MALPFSPYISYRLVDSGGGIRDIGKVSESGLLHSTRPIVFFVHGYNNDLGDASLAYARFQGRLGDVSARTIGVYWPGDNWSSGAYYVQAVKKVDEVAKRFARDLHDAAIRGAKLDLSFVAHSLGCRVTLETLRELRDLLRRQPVAHLKVHKVVFMAAAVPTFILEQNRPLNQTIRDLDLAMRSLHSVWDDVLRIAFPAGQSLAGEGLFPTALGRREWRSVSTPVPKLTQAENRKANHGDYWGGGSRNIESLQTAANEARSFIQPPPERSTAVRQTSTARVAARRRETPIRLT